VSVEDGNRLGWPSTSRMTENVEKTKNSSWEIVAEQFMSLQTPMESVMEFARRF
jgi:hypothetical protein